MRAPWLACVLTAFLFPVALIACASDEPDTVADVLSYLASEYTAPLVDAAPLVVCEFVDPRTENPDCAAFVATVGDRNPVLDRAIVRLEGIAARVSPRDKETAAVVNEGIAALVAVDQADESVIDSWTSGDIEKWRDSWALSEEASLAWARFIQDVYRIARASESPSAPE